MTAEVLRYLLSWGDSAGGLQLSEIRGRDRWRQQGDGCRRGAPLGGACTPPGGRAEVWGEAVANRDSCSLISSSINT